MDNNIGEVVLVKDINVVNNTGINYGFGNSSSPDDLTVFDGKLYFSAFEPETGVELWSSDGTTDGTQLVADVIPGSRDYSGSSDSFDPVNIAEFNDKLYFSAATSETGRELWVSDGTADGTQLVADINPNGRSLPGNFTEFNGKLYFSADNGENGDELWVTDGTTGGTQLVADINSGDGDSFPANFAEFDGKLYFSADDGENGDELWVTDGTTGGTQLFEDIFPGISNFGFINSSRPRNLAEFDGKLYFSADDGENGTEPWVTDGTPEGTQLFVDIFPISSDNGFASGSFPGGFTEFNGKLYFDAQNDENGIELWATDGTTGGTQLVADINPNGRSDPGNFTVFNGKLYFSADDGVNGRELWVSDGTPEGTQLVADILSGEGGSFPTDLTVLNDELYFSADDGENGRELYKLTFDDPNQIIGTLEDDTIEGTNRSDRIKGLRGDDVIFALGGNDTVFGDIFDDELNGGDGDDDLLGGLGNDTLNGGNGNDLLVGREGNDFFVLTQNEGTDTISDFDPEEDSFVLSGGLSFEDLTLTGNQIQIGDSVIAVVEGVDTSTLSASNFDEEEIIDNNIGEVVLVKDINAVNNTGINYGFGNSSSPNDLTVFDGKLYFSAFEPETGVELWSSDGTTEGTQIVADVIPGSRNYLDDADANSGYDFYPFKPKDLIEFDGKLYFSGENFSETGRELWSSDGTAEGTQLVADIDPIASNQNKTVMVKVLFPSILPN